jgi:phosphoglycerol transferase MdoB-like AlkP superfamily enzyme
MFNYLLGIYGHHPFYRNTKKRPDVIFEDSNNEQIHRISNQYYYRTKAIYEYVTELRKIDPNSIIIIVSDHLPPLDKGKGEYERLGYLKDINDKRKLYFNTMLVFDGDKVIKYNLVHHFNVPVIIMNLLTDGYYCKINKCHLDGKPYKKEDYLNKYLTIVTEKTLPE